MIKSGLLFISILIFSLIGESELHDFHLSNSQLKYKQSKNVLQLSVKIFIDDLETALAQRNVHSLYIGTEKESEDSTQYIDAYLKDVIIISSSEDTLSSNFIGKELSEDLSAIWCYLQFDLNSDCMDLQVTNSLLTEIFEDQKNIFSFSTEDGNKQYFTFDSRDKVKKFSCE